MRHPCASQRGFTLIEVLIASAIAIASMGLLLQLFGSGLDRLNRVSLSAHRIVAEKEIINRLSTINPALSSKGKGVVEGLKYSWKVKQLKPYQHVSPTLGEIPYPRYVALYQINIELIRQDGYKSQLEITRLGWKGTP